MYSRSDKSSSSNPDSFAPRSLHLDWAIHFGTKSISGSAKYTFDVQSVFSNQLILDSSLLTIDRISINDTPVTYTTETFSLGSKLSINIPEDILIQKSFELVVHYVTNPEASAVQWLPPSATKGKKHPYMFTQGQAIHTRSLIPSMDSPGVKFPYTASVKAPEWCTVLMSALQVRESTACSSPVGESGGWKIHEWAQPIPTSTYLITIAAGELASQDISPRVRVWSEPQVVDSAAYEFAETEKFLQAAEDLTGYLYPWTRYDILLLPPSFPYGGMENPCLTFATPTLLAGDRSLADVIAHEAAHSWTGNLVTNHTWEHFWLNEGWTVWLERKIIQRVKGDMLLASQSSSSSSSPSSSELGLPYFLLSSQIGWNDLSVDISRREKEGPEGLQYTSLVWPLKEGVDPDDAFGSVPYEKGFNLLYYLECTIGTEAFSQFFKAYIHKFKSVTLTTGDFKDFFLSLLPSLQPPLSPETIHSVRSLDWDTIFLGQSMLPFPVPDFSNILSRDCDSLSDRWIEFYSSPSPPSVQIPSSVSETDLNEWSTQQQCRFLENLQAHVKSSSFNPAPSLNESTPSFTSLLRRMDTLYSLSTKQNAEIKFRWQMLVVLSATKEEEAGAQAGVEAGVQFILPHIVDFLLSQGRMKFVRPLYRALSSCPSCVGLALQTFDNNLEIYHPITRKMVATDLQGKRVPPKQATPLIVPEEIELPKPANIPILTPVPTPSLVRVTPIPSQQPASQGGNPALLLSLSVGSLMALVAILLKPQK